MIDLALDMEAVEWSHHLNDTLFKEGNSGTWAEAYDNLWANSRHDKARGSKTKASRQFLLECRNCNAAVKGTWQYQPRGGYARGGETGAVNLRH